MQPPGLPGLSPQMPLRALRRDRTGKSRRNLGGGVSGLDDGISLTLSSKSLLLGNSHLAMAFSSTPLLSAALASLDRHIRRSNSPPLPSPGGVKGKKNRT